MKKVIFILVLFMIGACVFARSYDIDASDLMKSVQIAMSNPDYMVTAGDVYNLSYAAGNTAISYNIAVDSSYKVRISNLAVLDAKGKTFIELKNSVEAIVSKNYPFSGVQFVLTSPSTFKVAVTGEIEKTIEANAWSLTRISTFLNYPELTEYASYRFITVTSASGASVTYDLFMAERFGDMSQNPYVRPGDVININRVERSVELIGAVERPGTYELKEDENLKDLVEFYGHGLKTLADTSRIQIQRHSNSTYTSGENFYISSEEIKNNYVLKNLDKITISTFETISPVVYFEGAVFDQKTNEDGTDLNTASRITVKINENTNLAFLIRDYSEYFTMPEADLQNAYVVRGKESFPINIEKIFYDSKYYSDFIMQPLDTLVVPFRQFFVTVTGSVVSPGRYPYIPERTYEYYVGLAGGFKKFENAGKAVKIVNKEGKAVKQTQFITPECTITAEINAPTYYIEKYLNFFVTLFSIIATTITAVVYVKSL